ncbi:MAG: prepilin-type N-terminal cleavage/methylation domain-containing protein [Planctomycetota bacterium]|nr:prepilin-type N-terminal cleavage/methylation domain-containing protein [Planctomycetota bacterium]
MVKRAKIHRRGFTIAEMLIALAILAMILSAVSIAMHASLQNYGENTKIAELTQTARVVLNRMMSEIRTTDAVDSASQRVSIIPPQPDPGNLTEIEYELDGGVLYCRRTVSGTQTSEPLIASDEDVQVAGFTITRETDIDGDDIEYTKCVTVRLDLQSSGNIFSVTRSACPRRNMEY